MNAYGFIIGDNGAVTCVGGTKHHKLFGKRSIDCVVSPMGTSFIINDKLYEAEGFVHYASDMLDCFAKLENNAVAFGEKSATVVRLESVSEGFYSINNSVLYEFRDIKKNKNLKLREDLPKPDAKRRSVTSLEAPSPYLETPKSNLKSVVLNGKRLTDGEGISILDNRVVFTDLTPTENLYIEHKDGSYSDVQLVKPISLGQFYLLKSFSGVFNFMENYRGVVVKNSAVSYSGTSTSKAKLTVTRSNETVDLDAVCLWLGDLEMLLREHTFHLVHPDQKTPLDYGALGMSDPRTVTKVEIVNGEGSIDGLVVKPTSWKTIVKCYLDDGTTCFGTIFREQLPFSIKQEAVVRFDESSIFELKSDCYYMINGEIFNRDTKGDTYKATFDGDEKLAIFPRKGLESYGLYSTATGEWRIFPTKVKAKFNTLYIGEIFSTQKEHVQLDEIGSYDPKDKWSYTVNGKLLPADKPSYKVSVPKDIRIEALIEEVKCNAKNNDGDSFDFTVRFVHESRSKVSFILPQDEHFATQTQRRASFSSKPTLDEPFFTYGRFRSPQGKMLYAYGNEVMNGSISANTYPIITFNGPDSGVVNTAEGTLPIKTFSLTDDMELKGIQKFVRLNNCYNVVFENSNLLIPSNTGVCFFRADNNIYLIKSALARGVSFASLDGSLTLSKTPKSNSNNASPAGSPRDEPVAAPKAVRSIAPARVEAPVVAAPATQLKGNTAMPAVAAQSKGNTAMPAVAAPLPVRTFLPPAPQPRVTPIDTESRVRQVLQRMASPAVVAPKTTAVKQVATRIVAPTTAQRKVIMSSTVTPPHPSVRKVLPQTPVRSTRLF